MTGPAQARSSRPDVRNPLLGLPAAQALLDMLTPDQAAAFKALFREMAAQARAKEAESYRKRKGPMVAYWMATNAWCIHLKNLMGRKARRG